MSNLSVFQQAIESNDILSLRIMMKDSLLADLSFKRFQEMESQAENISQLYDAHDNSEMNQSPSMWDIDYMNKLMVEVINNFSHERLKHLKEVVRYLYPLPKEMKSPSQTSSSVQHSPSRKKTYREQKEEDRRNGRIVKICASGVAGGGVGYGVAILIEAPVVAGVVVGAVVAATIATIANK